MTQCDIVVKSKNDMGEDIEEIQKVVRFEMFIDAESLQAMKTGKGVVPDMFQRESAIGRSAVPFKAWKSDHSKALDGFARAYRRGHVNGLPVSLIDAYMEESEFLRRALAADIFLNATMPGTVSFAKPFNQQNYPSLVVKEIEISEEEAEGMLGPVLAALPVKRKFEDMTK